MVPQHLGHFLASEERVAQVSGHYAPRPVQVLFIQRSVQPQVLHQLLDRGGVNHLNALTATTTTTA